MRAEGFLRWMARMAWRAWESADAVTVKVFTTTKSEHAAVRRPAWRGSRNFRCGTKPWVRGSETRKPEFAQSPIIAIACGLAANAGGGFEHHKRDRLVGAGGLRPRAVGRSERKPVGSHLVPFLDQEPVGLEELAELRPLQAYYFLQDGHKRGEGIGA